jgi:hypothetical protein
LEVKVSSALPTMPYLEDVLYGVFARLQHEFPNIAPDRVASSVEAARTPALDLLPDLSAYASAVAHQARQDLASCSSHSAGRLTDV